MNNAGISYKIIKINFIYIMGIIKKHKNTDNVIVKDVVEFALTRNLDM